MTKKIIITWDLDGFIGGINSTSPYNFDFSYLFKELDCVKRALALMHENGVSSTFAITGFQQKKGFFHTRFLS